METNGKPETPRPADPFTAADAARLYNVIDGMTKKIDLEVRGIGARLATIDKAIIDINSGLNLIESGLSQTRVGRLEIEIAEAERERDLAMQRLKIADENLNVKQGVKDQSVDTNEKIKVGTASALADLERKKKESSEAFIVDLKRSIVKAVLTALAVSGTFGVLAFIWFLAQLYLNR